VRRKKKQTKQTNIADNILQAADIVVEVAVATVVSDGDHHACSSVIIITPSSFLLWGKPVCCLPAAARMLHSVPMSMLYWIPVAFEWNFTGAHELK
jgi:hypothetical protein